MSVFLILWLATYTSNVHDVTTMTYVDAGVMFQFYDLIKLTSAIDILIDISGWTIIFELRCEFLLGRVRKWCGFSGDLCTHHRGRLASSEFRMAAWRASSRGVDWTAPHPAINKLAEREQPRDEPFNSATFCLPSPFYSFSSPLAVAFPPVFFPLPACSLFFSVTLAISDSARALLLCFATR